MNESDATGQHRRSRVVRAPGSELPTRFHIGTPRAGSSFLFNLLRSHPGVALDPVQDVNFYTNNFERGVAWYLAGFPAHGVRIDTSPTYFAEGDQAAPRIRQSVGARDPRFLLVLRNPIDYARSHYQLQARRGSLQRNRDRYPVLPESFVDFVIRYDGWLDRARYAQVLRRSWFAIFAKTQFKIVLFENLITQTDRVTAEVCDFFELPPRPLRAERLSQNRTLRHPALYQVQRGLNRGPRGLKRFVKRSRPLNSLYARFMVDRSTLSDADRAQLAEILADDVATLKSLLDDPLPQWKDFA